MEVEAGELREGKAKEEVDLNALRTELEHIKTEAVEQQLALHESEATCELLRADLAAARTEQAEQMARAEDACRQHEVQLREAQTVVGGQVSELQALQRDAEELKRCSDELVEVRQDRDDMQVWA